jgi:hypothetical protein
MLLGANPGGRVRTWKSKFVGDRVKSDLGIIGAAKLAECRRLPTVSLGEICEKFPDTRARSIVIDIV